MLNKVKLIAEIEKNVCKIFYNNYVSYDALADHWALLSADNAFLAKLAVFNSSPWPIPSWSGSLNQAIPVVDSDEVYDVLSVDGSQIYPERHMKSYCFLINIGLVKFSYHTDVSSVFFETWPKLYPLSEDDYSIDIINGIRHENELMYGFQQAKIHFKSYDRAMLLFDGSFIFWHLDLQKGLRERFLEAYLGHLYEGYVHKIPAVAYISSPKSKELVSILRLFLCKFNIPDTETYHEIDNTVDATLVASYVPVGYRTIVFQNKSPISLAYPDTLKTHFFYINLGQEVARVEFPAWIADNTALVDRLASFIKDQAEKGYGYPVALAEAHEQAVIKTIDRDFFYTYLDRANQKYLSLQSPHPYSQKLLQKKMMRV